MSTEQPGPPFPTNERDPFPKMIIVCAMISAVLFVIIASVLAYDFVQRQKRTIHENAPALVTPSPIPPKSERALPEGEGPAKLGTTSAGSPPPAQPALPNSGAPR